MMIYLYLGRRDKSETKVLGLFNGPEVQALRVGDLGEYNLPDDIFKGIQSEIYENRMLWEPWIESASSYEELKIKLRERGYKNVPYKMTLPQYQMRNNVVSSVQEIKKPTIDTKAGSAKKTMLRKTKLS